MNDPIRKISLTEAHGFTILATHYEYRTRFEVYKIAGTQDDGTLLYDRKGATSWPDPVETLDEAQMFLSGDVKWDGCSNWVFEEPPMIHFCSRQELVDVGLVLAACWDLATDGGKTT